MGDVVDFYAYASPRYRPPPTEPATISVLPMIRDVPMTSSDRDVLAILRAQREAERDRAPKPFPFVVDVGVAIDVPFSVEP